MLTFWKKHAPQCLPQFLWRRRHFGKCESLGSSPVKCPRHSMTLQSHSISFKFLYFHWKVNTFKTPEMCLYLDSDVWAGWFTIIFAGSFHYFKAGFLLNPGLWKCHRHSTTLRSTSIAHGKGKHVWNSWNASLFRLWRLRRMSQVFLLDLFLILSFLPKLTVQWDESSRPKIVQ